MKKFFFILLGLILVLYGILFIFTNFSDIHSFREMGKMIDKFIGIFLGIYLIIKGSKSNNNKDKTKEEDDDEKEVDFDYNEIYEEEKKS